MAFDCLQLSDRFSVDYCEIGENRREIRGGYDFYLFNYHVVTMAWLDVHRLTRLAAPKLALVLEVAPGDPFAMCPPNVFDAYCALDPTLRFRDPRVYAFPRPLEVMPIQEDAKSTSENLGAQPAIPIIGTFGFATTGKGFERVVRAANEEFTEALIRINIPCGAHADPSGQLAARLAENCRREAKAGVRVEVTHDFLTKAQLITWCQGNTLNCFLYDRTMPGLSATTDQAITSGRPLAISANSTFRHIIEYVVPYPLRTLRESIVCSPAEIQRMQVDWAPKRFAARFEEVLSDLRVFDRTSSTANSPRSNVLPKVAGLFGTLNRAKRALVKVHGTDLVPPLLGKVARRMFPRYRWRQPRWTIPTFHHPALGSFGQFHEDLLVDLILGSRKDGCYIDIGANDPEFNSNTLRFYRRGWTGVCVEPGAEAFRRIAEHRPRDLNLNLAIGPERSRMIFYRVVDDSTLSSLDEASARRMAFQVGSTVVADDVEVWPLRDVFAEHASDRRVDFLSVDAEGYDLTVLQSNDWERYRPTLLLVEINNQFYDIVQWMGTQNYLRLFNNPDNGLFIDKHTTDAGVRAVLNGAPLI